MQSAAAFAVTLTSIPALAPLYEEHLATYGELLPHVLMGDVSRAVLDLHARDDRALGGILERLEEGMRAGSEDIQELVAVSFAENVAAEAHADPAFRARFGPALELQLREILRAWGYEPPPPER